MSEKHHHDCASRLREAEQERDGWERAAKEQAAKRQGEVAGWTGKWREAVDRAETAEAKVRELEAERDELRADLERLKRAHKANAESLTHAVCHQIPEAEARLASLIEAVERLQNGPDTLTPDGLKIVLAALYPRGMDDAD